MAINRSRVSGQFKQADAERRRPNQQQRAERRAELARLSEQVAGDVEAASNRIAAQMAASKSVATGKVDTMAAHEARLAKMRERGSL